MKDLGTWLDKYGLSVVMLAAASMFFKFSVWPLVVKWFETSEKRADVAETFLKEQIKAGQEQVLRSENRNQKICDDFIASLDRMNARQDSLIQEFRRLEDAIGKR